MKILIAFLCLFAGAFAQTAWVNQSPSGLTDDVWAITFSDETFVAVTGAGKVLSSPDGLAWSSNTVLPGRWLVSITRGAGLWVAVGDGGVIIYSADLKAWTAAKSSTTVKLNGVTWSGQEFVAVGENGTVLISTDAQNWSARKSGTSNFLRGIVAVPSNSTPGLVSLIATGGAGTVLQSTDHGFTWIPQALTQTAFPGSLMLTPDPASIPNFECVLAQPGIVLTAGNGSAVTRFTVDQPTARIAAFKETSLLKPSVILRGITAGSGAFVAVGEQGAIFTSPDGIAWIQRFSGSSPAALSNATLLAVAYSDSLRRFVAVGSQGTILVSDAPASVLANVATRGIVTSTDPLIGGFVVSGVSKKNVLIRAIGPTLALFGVAKSLPDPVLTVYDSANKIVAKNVTWGTSDNLAALIVATAHGAFPLPDKSSDSALFLSLAPGSYTAVITSASGATGGVLFEAYSQ